jgi:hypothetical protein
MQIRLERNRTSTVIVMYSLYLYFLGLSLRNTSKVLVIFRDKKQSLYVCMELDIDLVHILSTNVKDFCFHNR